MFNIKLFKLPLSQKFGNEFARFRGQLKPLYEPKIVSLVLLRLVLAVQFWSNYHFKVFVRITGNVSVRTILVCIHLRPLLQTLKNHYDSCFENFMPVSQKLGPALEAIRIYKYFARASARIKNW